MAAILTILLFGGFCYAIWILSNDKNRDTRGKFVTKLEENRAVAVMRGGRFNRFVGSSGNRTIELVDGAWQVLDKPPTYSGFPGFLEEAFGIHWIGFYPFETINVSKFIWYEWKQEEKDGKITYTYWKRDDKTYFFYLSTFGYALFLDGVETAGDEGKEEAGNLSLDIRLTLFIRIRFPQRALFDRENWYEELSKFVTEQGRTYAGTHSYESLRADGQKHDGESDFAKHIMEFNLYILQHFGVEIEGVQILTIDLDEESAGLLAATQAAFKATREAEAFLIKTKSEGEAKKIIALADGEAERIRGDATAYSEDKRMEVVAKHGAVGMHVVRQDAVIQASKHGKATVIFTNDNDSKNITEKVVGAITAGEAAKS